MIKTAARLLAGLSLFPGIIIFGLFLTVASPVVAQESCIHQSCLSSWLTMSDNDHRSVFDFAEGYKAYMHKARTELTAVAETVRLARAAGFSELTEASPLTPGARYYTVNRDRAMVLMVIGARPISEGVRLVAAHIDSPRLELKGRPLYEREGFAQFQTNFHGGIKTYQWTNIPLALVGRVDKKDGSTVNISVGLEPGEPAFIIPDLAPHVDRELRDRKRSTAIEFEELDPIIAHLPKSAEENVMAQVVDFLRDTYDISLEDLVSAELSLVPAFPPRDIGFDRGLMAIFGQDDRLSAYASLQSILGLGTPEVTAMVHLVDNEESGSVNNTGAASAYFFDLVGELIFREMGDEYREPYLKRALAASRVISIDVNPGINPIWPSAFEEGNAPRLGHGINFKLYGRGFSANSEYTAWTRNYLDKAGVPWQTVTYKVNGGGGGTVGKFYSEQNMEVIDFGVPVLSIHTPYAVSSKADVYWLYQAVKAFYETS